MKFWKYTLVSAIAFFGISASVVYTSCVKDSCESLRCRNNGTCLNGFCQCPAGYEGTECEITAATKFSGTYRGNTKCELAPAILDTVYISLEALPDKVNVYQSSNKLSFKATVIANEITVPDVEGAYIKIKLDDDHKRITLTSEQMVNNQLKTCTFIGTK